MERWYLLVTGNFLFWTFRWWEKRSFFQPKSWWKDDIYLVFLSFPWYSKTWEIRFFVQCYSAQVDHLLSMFIYTADYFSNLLLSIWTFFQTKYWEMELRLPKWKKILAHIRNRPYDGLLYPQCFTPCFIQNYAPYSIWVR